MDIRTRMTSSLFLRCACLTVVPPLLGNSSNFWLISKKGVSFYFVPTYLGLLPLTYKLLLHTNYCPIPLQFQYQAIAEHVTGTHTWQMPLCEQMSNSIIKWYFGFFLHVILSRKKGGREAGREAGRERGMRDGGGRENKTCYQSEILKLGMYFIKIGCSEV